MKNAYTYVGTPLALTDGETYHLQKYVKKGRAAGRIVAWESFDLDLEALATPIQLDCAHCHLAHRESCCEGGYPFPPAQELLPMLDQHVGRISADYLSPQAGQHIAKWGPFEAHVETSGYSTIGTYMGNCLFCQTEGDGPACMAHRYALANDLTPEQLKPLSCLLYPLDLIADEAGRVLVTALTERTERFSRWGAEYRLDFLCANRELRVAVAAGVALEVRPNIRTGLPEDVFAVDQYRPAYLEARGTLTRLYGEALWQEIDARLCQLQAKEKWQS